MSELLGTTATHVRHCAQEVSCALKPVQVQGVRLASTTAAPDRHHSAPMRSAFVRESGAAR